MRGADLADVAFTRPRRRRHAGGRCSRARLDDLERESARACRPRSEARPRRRRSCRVGVPARRSFARAPHKGIAVRWPGGCAFVQPDSGGTPDLPTDARVRRSMQKSMANWMNAVGDAART